MTRSQKEAIDDRTSQTRAVGDVVTDAIKDALEELASDFNITPSGNIQGQPATRQLFKLTPSTSGLNISVPGLSPLPVTVQVTWKVFRDKGNVQEPLSEGAGFDATPDLNTNPAETGILFFPQLAEDITGAATTAKFIIRASVKLSVTPPLSNPVTVGPTALPDVRVVIPVLLVPTMLAFFRHKDFKAAEGNKPGFALITVPLDSAVKQLQSASDLVGSGGKLTLLESQVSTLIANINKVSSQVQSLAALAGNLTVFLTGLRKLKSLLANSQMAIGICPRGASDNLNKITLIDRGFPGNDIEAEVEISSLIALGISGEIIKCYNKRHFKPEQGVLGITLGSQMCAVVGNLDVANPVSEVGNAQVRALEPAKIPLRRNTFDYAFSSYHFGNNPPRT
jgi:hypothetical protein